MKDHPQQPWKHMHPRSREKPGILILVLLSLCLSVLLALVRRSGTRSEENPAGEIPGEMVRWLQEGQVQDAKTGSSRTATILSGDGSERSVNRQRKHFDRDSSQREERSLEDTKDDRKNLPAGIRTIDLNRADSTGLLPLKGIGPVYSVRIIKYRALLGGFIDPWQLTEVYGLDSSVVHANKGYIHTSPESVRQINLNTAGWKDLVRHPYINSYQANAILALRSFRGDSLTDPGDLLREKIFTPEEWKKAGPYLFCGNKNLQNNR